MSTEEKKMLIEVTAETSKAQEKIVALRKRVDELKEAQKKAKEENKDGGKEYERLTAEIQQTNKEIRKNQNVIQKATELDMAKEGSLAALRAELSLAKAAYIAMGEEERKNSEAGKKLQADIAERVELLKTEEKAIGDTSRNVGNYEDSITNAIKGNKAFGQTNIYVTQTTKIVQGGLKGLSSMLKKLFAMIIANPVVAILGAIILLFKAFSSVVNSSEESSARLNAIMAPLKRVLDAVMNILQKTVGFILSIVEGYMALGMAISKLMEKLPLVGKYFKAFNKEIEESVKLEKEKYELDKRARKEEENGAKRSMQVAELRNKIAQKEKYSAQERLAMTQEAIDLERKGMEEKRAIALERLRIAEDEASRAENTKQTEEELSKMRAAVYKAEEEYQQGTKRLREAENTALREMASEQKAQAEEAKKQQNAEYERLQKIGELKLKRFLVENALTEEALSNDLKIRQNYERKIFNREEEAEKESLALKRKYGKITAVEYDIQIRELAAKRQQFNGTQAKEVFEFFKEVQGGVLEIVGETIENQVKEVEKHYSELLEKMGNLEMPTPEGITAEEYDRQMDEFEAFVIQKSELETELEKKKQEEIRDIKKAFQDNQIKEIEALTAEGYQEDYARYADNERKKTETTIRELTERIKLKKQQGLDTIADEIALRAAQSKLSQIQFNSELIRANNNAQLKYEVTKAYLEKEADLHKGNADKQLEISKQLAANERELLESRIASFEEWSGNAAGLMNNLHNLTKANEEAELKEYEDDNNQKKDSLKKRFDAGLMSQDEYNKQVEASDKELDRKKAEIARKQAIRERLMKAFEIGVNTASAIVKAVAALPLTGGLPFSALAAATGAIQLATVLATPLPKASRGMLLRGKSHAQGGIPIEAEGGEAIINRRSTRMFAPILSAINQAGGGVPFMNTQPDGGYSLRKMGGQGLTSEEITKSMKEAVGDLKIYTTVEDVRRGEQNYTEIEASANY